MSNPSFRSNLGKLAGCMQFIIVQQNHDLL